LEEVIPKEYHAFLQPFSKVIAETLPPHRLYDHKITLQERFTPPFGPIYSLALNELEVMKNGSKRIGRQDSFGHPHHHVEHPSSQHQNQVEDYGCTLIIKD
jgi:hypothetical protein